MHDTEQVFQEVVHGITEANLRSVATFEDIDIGSVEFYIRFVLETRTSNFDNTQTFVRFDGVAKSVWSSSVQSSFLGNI